MLIMDWISSVIAIALTIIIAIAVYANPHLQKVGNWGDATEAAKHMNIRRNLLGLRRSKYHPKIFRPSYLIILPEHPSPHHRNIARVAYTLRKGYGTTHIGIVNVTDTPHQDLFARQLLDNAGFYKLYDRDAQRDEAIEAELLRQVQHGTTLSASGVRGVDGAVTKDARTKLELDSMRLQIERKEARGNGACADCFRESRRSQDRMFAMMDYVNAPDLRTGAMQLMQICGVGPLRPNTLLQEFKSTANLSQAETQAYVHRVFHCIQDALRMRMNVVVVRLNTHEINFYKPRRLPARRYGCDTWWVMDDGGFSLMVPHILLQGDYWQTVTNNCEQKSRYCALNNAALSGIIEAETRHLQMLKNFRLNWPVDIVGLERQDDNGRLYTDLESIASEVLLEYNAIPYAENLDQQGLDETQRQTMLRWLAVAAVMRRESSSTHLVCGNLPFTRR